MDKRGVPGGREGLERGRDRGVTLIELMVVCSIIMLVLSLMLPAVYTAKLKAKKTICDLQRKSITRYDEQTDRFQMELPTPVLSRCYECHIPNRYRQP